MLSIYRASAGSGKTFTLAYEYIKLLLGYKDGTGPYRLNRYLRNSHRSILAITFTNKATDEMKRRIVHELAVIGRKEPDWSERSPYVDDLIKLFQCSEEELVEAATIALHQLLFDFNFFQVSTIDSFFQTILRTFAREAELSGNYEVELNGDSAIDEGLARMFSALSESPEASESKHLVNWITVYLLKQLGDGKKVNLMNRESMPYRELLKLIKGLSDETLSIRFNEMMDYLDDLKKLDRFNSVLSEKIAQVRIRAYNCSLNAVETIDSRIFPKGKIKDNVRKCFVDYLTTGKFKTSIDKYPELGVEIAYSKDLKNYLSDHPDPVLDDAISKGCEALLETRGIVRLWEELHANTFVLGILSAVFRKIDDYRKENNTLLLSDTNGLLRNIIGEEETPFVYERMGVGLQNFLIDEFQDTSRLQWENLRPLLSHSLAEEHDSLVIGDGKQCIYRFRNSDPTLLSEEIIKDFPRSSKIVGGDEKGNTNWRSSAIIVEFNNKLFKTLAKEYASDVYENVEQRVSPKNENKAGYVKIVSVAKGENQAENLMKLMADEICRQIKSGYHAGDIAILVRNNSEGINVINYLKNRRREDPDFPITSIVSEDVMNIGSSPAVKMIISTLRLLSTQSSKEQSKDTIIDDKHTSDQGYSKKDVADLAARYDSIIAHGETPECALEMALNGSGKLERFSSRGIWTLMSLIEEIVATKIPEDIYCSQQAYISAFFDLVLDYSQVGLNDIKSFLKWWDTTGSRSNLVSTPDGSSLSVMTIHKSKGLQFPCVHIPIGGWVIEDFKNVEWFDMSQLTEIGLSDDVPPMIPLRPGEYMRGTPLESQYLKRVREVNVDELNAMYVGFTRAESELCVWNAEGRRNNQTGPLLLEGLKITFGAESLVEAEDGNSVFVSGLPTKPHIRRQPEQLH